MSLTKEALEQHNAATKPDPRAGLIRMKNESGEYIWVTPEGCEVRSDDGSDDGADLKDFVVDDDEDDDAGDCDTEDDEEDEDPEALKERLRRDEQEALEEARRVGLIVTGKRNRRAPERYVHPEHLKVMCKDSAEARAFLGKAGVEMAKKSGVVLPPPRARTKKDANDDEGEDCEDCEGCESLEECTDDSEGDTSGSENDDDDYDSEDDDDDEAEDSEEYNPSDDSDEDSDEDYEEDD